MVKKPCDFVKKLPISVALTVKKANKDLFPSKTNYYKYYLTLSFPLCVSPLLK